MPTTMSNRRDAGRVATHRAGLLKAGTALLALVIAGAPLAEARAADASPVSGPVSKGARPWMDTSLSPDARAVLLDQAMTMDERVSILHGIMVLPEPAGFVVPKGLRLTAGHIPGVPRLGIPALEETDATLGVANPHGLRPGDGATSLPSGLAIAATWNPTLAYQGGAMVGDEAARMGFNVLLGGGVDLTREVRNGRNFEYLGEDPLLAGTLAGEGVRGVQDQHVVDTVKHYAFNSQETGRHVMNARIADAPARESDLLAFEIAIEKGHPGSVMCAYNRVNGPWSCDSDALLNGVLKGDWHYPGWVMSDWGAVPSLSTASHGLDQQSGEQLDPAVFFGDRLKQAVAAGQVPESRVHDMARRILRSLFAVGVFDHPAPDGRIDYAAHAQVSRAVAAQAIVLLKNRDGVLPLTPGAAPGGRERLAVIGGRADFGVLSGGGSAQVWPVGGPDKARQIYIGGTGELKHIATAVYQPSSPLRAIRAHMAPGAEGGDAGVSFTDGRYISAAVAAARKADVAVVFATQFMMEGQDAPDLSLPDGQDALIAAVAAANPRTIVVLETGGAVAMPWLDKVAGVVEAWYPGTSGGEAIADVLFGTVDPSGRLPITFPADVAQTPRPVLPGADLPRGALFDVDLTEGADVGYKWFIRHHLKPLFPFGYGLSYSRYERGGLTLARDGQGLSARFTLSNRGTRPGMDTAQLYLVSGPDGTMPRLLGWRKVGLKPGEAAALSLTIDPRLLAVFDPAAHRWRIKGGTYTVALGGSAEDLGPAQAVHLDDAMLAP